MIKVTSQKPFEWLTTEFQTFQEEPLENYLQAFPGQPVGDFLALAGRIDVVCQIVLPPALDGKERHGTGFLIGPGLLLTNNHVLPNPETANLSKARFFYEPGKEPVEVEFNLDEQKKGFFLSSPTPDPEGKIPLTAHQLDFTIVAINHHPRISKVYHQSFSIFETVNLKPGGKANIIQHPIDETVKPKKNGKANIVEYPTGEDLAGEKKPYKRFAFRDNTILEIDKTKFIVHYQTPTTRGSSGSPVMNDEARLFGLHRSRCTDGHENCNNAILMGPIIEEIKRRGCLDKIQKWSLPFSSLEKRIALPEKTKNFVGRQQELGQIKNLLISSSDPIVLVALTGQGGIGKTQLALQYAYSSEEYEKVIWIQANTEDNIKASYKTLAEKIGIEITEDEKGNDALLVKKAIEWLEKNADWLLVIDDAESLSEIFPYLPKKDSFEEELLSSEKRHVLITSRFTDWEDYATVIPVKLFTEEESLALLKKTLKEKGRNFEEEKVQAKELVNLLGNLSLAVSQAAYYIHHTRIPISRYIEQLRQTPGILLDRNPDRSPSKHKETVKATYITSMNHISELEQEEGSTTLLAKEILMLCSFFNPNEIPIKFLEEWFSKEYKDPATSIFFDTALRLLRSYSLLHIEKETFSIHPLVQTVAGEMIPSEKKEDAFHKAAEALEKLGTFYSNKRNFFKSLESYESSLKIKKQIFGENSIDVAQTYSNIGHVLMAQGDLTGAKEYHEKAIKICITCLKTENHLSVYESYNNIGNVLKRQGDLIEAKEYHKKALKICITCLKTENHLDVAKTYNNIGNVLQLQGDLTEAKKYLEKALKIKITCLKTENHVSVADTYNSIGLVLMSQGDVTGAKEYFEKALQIFIDCLKTENDTDVAGNYSNIGLMLMSQGDLIRAKEHFEKALHIFITCFKTENHTDVASNYNNIGNVLVRQEDLTGAKEYYEKALQIHVISLKTKKHTSVADSYNNIGLVLMLQQDLTGAKRYLEKALKIRIDCLGENHASVAASYLNLGDFYLSSKELQQAKEYYVKAKQIYQQTFGNEYDKLLDDKIMECQQK